MGSVYLENYNVPSIRLKQLVFALTTGIMMSGCSIENNPDSAQNIGNQEQSSAQIGIDPSQTSQSPSYGYSIDNPIKLGGSGNLSDVEAEQIYLLHLRDQKYRRLNFIRIGSVGKGPDGHILDQYSLQSADGHEYTLYIDMYHPEIHPFHALAPKGFFLWK